MLKKLRQTLIIDQFVVKSLPQNVDLPEIFLAKSLHHHRFPILVQGHGLFTEIKILILYLSACEKIDGSLFGKNPERFDEIEDQGFLVVIVRVEEAHIGVKRDSIVNILKNPY
jgi:hypothetical protein